MKMKFSFVAAAVAAVIGSSVAAEELKFANFTPPFHTINASVIELMNSEVSAATGGALTVRGYHGGELGAGPVEQYVRVLQGVADVGWGLPGYTSSQFGKTMIAELPGAIDDGVPGYIGLLAAYNDHLAGEFPGVKTLALWTSEPNVMIMRNKEIHSPADLAGLKIRVAGATAAEVAVALGATPVQMPISEVYNALQTGLIDGVFTGSSTLIDFKLEFGRLASNPEVIVLADEISPDGCRLWDLKTGEKMDKDRFRRDLGNVMEAYEEVLGRVKENLA